MNTPDTQLQRPNQEARQLLQMMELGYVGRPWAPTKTAYSNELREATDERLDDVQDLQRNLTTYVAGVRQLENDPRLLPTAVRGLAYMLHYQADSLFQHVYKLESQEP